MDRILTTGATGFVGQRLLKLFESYEHKIQILSRQSHPDYETIVCDLEEKNIPASALASVDTAFHLEGFAHDLSDASKVAEQKEVERDHLYKKVAQLQIEVDWLKKDRLSGMSVSEK